MNAPEASRFVRLRVELILEVTDSGDLADAALARITEDAFMPADERAHAQAAVRDDESEALSFLVDPTDLVAQVPGVALSQASWSSEPVDYDAVDDADDPDWDDDVDAAVDEGEEVSPYAVRGAAGRA